MYYRGGYAITQENLRQMFILHKSLAMARCLCIIEGGISQEIYMECLHSGTLKANGLHYYIRGGKYAITRLPQRSKYDIIREEDKDKF